MAEKQKIFESLFADESLTELSEDFKTKASVIFENAVAAKVTEAKKSLDEEYTRKLDEAKEEIRNELEEQIDSYLTYVAEEWMKDNELAVENGIQVEIAENFLSGMKELFEASYVEVPESKVDVVAEMAEELKKKENMLEKVMNENIEMNKKIVSIRRDMIISECASGLADTQVDKLKDLVEMIEYKDDDQFKERVSSIVETYINKKSVNEETDEDEDDNDSDDEKDTTKKKDKKKKVDESLDDDYIKRILNSSSM